VSDARAHPKTPAQSTADLSLSRLLIDWQRSHGRHHLPWQQTRDPYRVWLSEIMLQQTQVTTVLGYYERFLERFPDVEALAAAPLDDVLALWAGLGYYSRARNLHRCAQVVMQQHGGVFPQSAAVLETLPGIGRSTAAAVAAFCFGERVAIMDGNVKRVLTRVWGFGDDLSIAASERTLWARAQEVLPETGAGMEAYTQGLMDLGATICTPRQPSCLLCPWAGVCVAREQGRPEAYPVKTRKLKRGQRNHALLWMQRGDEEVWLVQRPDRGVWAGLWSLPEFDDVEGLQQWLSEGPGLGEVLPSFTHVLTHLDWALTPVRCRLQVDSPLSQGLAMRWPEGRWIRQAELDNYGLPAPVRKLLVA
jgi:A/G-specific adenine glycosylase